MSTKPGEDDRPAYRAFNAAERSWDCPCHGSRFAVDGSVLEGRQSSRSSTATPEDPSWIDPHRSIRAQAKIAMACGSPRRSRADPIQAMVPAADESAGRSTERTRRAGESTCFASHPGLRCVSSPCPLCAEPAHHADDCFTSTSVLRSDDSLATSYKSLAAAPGGRRKGRADRGSRTLGYFESNRDEHTSIVRFGALDRRSG